jgi:hypothetical protein
MFGLGIAAANNSHVNYFQSREMCDELYTILLRVMKIGVLSLAGVVQSMLNKTPRYRNFYIGAMGRYCACQAGYGGLNNNMGFEV